MSNPATRPAGHRLTGDCSLYSPPPMSHSKEKDLESKHPIGPRRMMLPASGRIAPTATPKPEAPPTAMSLMMRHESGRNALNTPSGPEIKRPTMILRPAGGKTPVLSVQYSDFFFCLLYRRLKTSEKHPGVICDGCRDSIAGPRFKCLNCDDFDFCAKCEVLSFIKWINFSN